MWSVNSIAGTRDDYDYCFIIYTTTVTVMDLDIVIGLR